MSSGKRSKSPSRRTRDAVPAAADFKPFQAPHGPITEVFPDIFQVRGTSNMGPMRITRNMTIVRHKGALTLINTVRLSDEGLRELEALGRIENVMKVAGLHGIDDPFYVRIPFAMGAGRGGELPDAPSCSPQPLRKKLLQPPPIRGPEAPRCAATVGGP